MASLGTAAALGLTALDTAIGKSSHDATMEVRLVDEKVQQLKAISNLSALIGGFAMVSIVELNIVPGHPQVLMFAFGTMAATVIALMMFSMVRARLKSRACKARRCTPARLTGDGRALRDTAGAMLADHGVHTQLPHHAPSRL